MATNSGDNVQLAIRVAGYEIIAWAASTRDAWVLAEALREARPHCRIRIDGNEAIFSREGKVVDFVNARQRWTGPR
jgi:hypothetical protein